MKPVSVAAFNSREEAEPLQERLLAAGIAAEIHNELPMDTGLGFVRASAGVRIEVPRADFETALRMVYDWNAGEDGTLDTPRPEWMALMSAEASAPARAGRGPGHRG